MRTYSIQINGVTPLLMHNDDIDWADQMERWKADKDNAAKSKAGDDRSPAHRWIGALYHDKEQVIVPTENIMRALMQGGAKVPVPRGKNGKTFKAQSQSGIIPRSTGWPLLVGNCERLPFRPIAALLREPNFDVHQKSAQAMGFDLFLKRAKIGASKHVRVRPRFETWSAAGELAVNDDQITDEVLASIFDVAGRYVAPVRSNRYNTVVTAWRKRLLLERGLQMAPRGGEFFVLTADQALGRGYGKAKGIDRAVGRLQEEVSYINPTQLSTDEHRAAFVLLRRESQALREATRKSMKEIAIPKAVSNRPALRIAK